MYHVRFMTRAHSKLQHVIHRFPWSPARYHEIRWDPPGSRRKAPCEPGRFNRNPWLRVTVATGYRVFARTTTVTDGFPWQFQGNHRFPWDLPRDAIQWVPMTIATGFLRFPWIHGNSHGLPRAPTGTHHGQSSQGIHGNPW